jgi:diaminohydroxyphosphoribosylaminopyrimidine deaminase/5-amino-6-(5-phosphoribosylamino)uracil reductase
LKWAESADGFIDLERTDGQPVILSSPLTSMLAHKRRAETDAIMVGTRTALLDNPSLTVRHWHGRHPLRVVFDRSLSLPHHLRLFDGRVPTLVFTAIERPDEKNVTYIRLNYARPLLPQALESLHQRGIQSLLVEGGSRLLQSFIDADLWDEAYCEKCPVALHTGVRAPRMDKACKDSSQACFGREVVRFLRSSL